MPRTMHSRQSSSGEPSTQPPLGGLKQSTCTGGLHIVNVRTPVNPMFAGCHYPHYPKNRTHDTHCVIYRGPDAEPRDAPHRERDAILRDPSKLLRVRRQGPLHSAGNAIRDMQGSQESFDTGHLMRCSSRLQRGFLMRLAAVAKHRRIDRKTYFRE